MTSPQVQSFAHLISAFEASLARTSATIILDYRMLLEQPMLISAATKPQEICAF